MIYLSKNKSSILLFSPSPSYHLHLHLLLYEPCYYSHRSSSPLLSNLFSLESYPLPSSSSLSMYPPPLWIPLFLFLLSILPLYLTWSWAHWSPICSYHLLLYHLLFHISSPANLVLSSTSSTHSYLFLSKPSQIFILPLHLSFLCKLVPSPTQSHYILIF